MGFFDQPLSEPIPEKHLKKPKEIVETLFGPQDFRGIRLHYSKKGLRPWEAGATWGKEIRLQPAFKQRLRFRLADRNEVIAHELIHALRSEFIEPIFEEMLAFSTAQQWGWLKKALCQRGLLWLLGSIAIGSCFSSSFVYGVIPIFFVLVAKRMRTFNRCCKKVGLEKMLFMRDEEIRLMAKEGHTPQRES